MNCDSGSTACVRTWSNSTTSFSRNFSSITPTVNGPASFDRKFP